MPLRQATFLSHDVFNFELAKFVAAKYIEEWLAVQCNTYTNNKLI